MASDDEILHLGKFVSLSQGSSSLPFEVEVEVENSQHFLGLPNCTTREFEFANGDLKRLLLVAHSKASN